MNRKEGIEKNIRKKKIGLISILFFLTLTIFIVLLTKTTFFHISEIRVNGNTLIEDEKIVLASGLEHGENIFKIDIDKVKANLEAHPYIKKAYVRRKMPNKINITVKERNELIVVPYIGSYVYIDDEGYILNVLNYKKEGTIIEVRGLDIAKINIGQEVILENDKDINDILSFISTCRETKILQQIEYIDVANKSNITLGLKSGTKVAFGEQNNVKYKLEFILEILRIRRENNEELRGVIDFTIGESPVFRIDDF